MEDLYSVKMKTEFLKDYYQETLPDCEGNYITQDGLKTMYNLRISKPYFCSNKSLVLKQAIADLEEELKRLKDIDKKNDNLNDRWDSISK